MGKMFSNLPKTQKPTEPSKPFISSGVKKKLKRTVLVVGVIVIIIALFWLFILISRFFDKHAFRFQTPLVIQSPVLMYDRQKLIQAEVEDRLHAELPKPPTPTPQPQYKYLNFKLVPEVYASEGFAQNPSNSDEAQIINSQKHAKIIWRIYELESTFGRNDDCKDNGLVNGFGFGINNSEHRCYTSFAGVVDAVNNWFDAQYKQGWDLGSILCYYNMGIRESSCGYMTKFLKTI